ncbi:MAG: MaoC family dehydratase [Actinomycetota bacterium]
MELRKRWFDDYTVGEVIDVPGDRLVTAERIVEFATEFDPQPFHTDPEAAARSIYGGLIASGWHTGSIMMSLIATVLGQASLGSPGCDSLRWTAPVRPGDRLSLRITVLDARPSTSKPDRGVVRFANELSNAAGEVVMTLESAMLMRRRSD